MGFTPGISRISDLSDSLINNPTTNNVLTYDATVLKWKNQIVPTAYAYFNSGSSTWSARPDATTVVWVGGDSTHPPTSPVVGKDIWLRDAELD